MRSGTETELTAVRWRDWRMAAVNSVSVPDLTAPLSPSDQLFEVIMSYRKSSLNFGQRLHRRMANRQTCSREFFDHNLSGWIRLTSPTRLSHRAAVSGFLPVVDRNQVRSEHERLTTGNPQPAGRYLPGLGFVPRNGSQPRNGVHRVDRSRNDLARDNRGVRISR